MNPSASTIFLVQLICLLVRLPISQCRSPVVVLNETLIKETCKKTPDYDICLFLLKRNGGLGIYSADRGRMADVMADVVGLRATEVLAKVIELERKTPNDQSLRICETQYTYIKLLGVRTIKRDIRMNHQAAGKLMRQIYDRAGEGCEYLFKAGTSPLTEFNLAIQKVASIAEAIIRQLG